MGTAELVTLAEAFIETLQDKTESSKVKEYRKGSEAAARGDRTPLPTSFFL